MYVATLQVDDFAALAAKKTGLSRATLRRALWGDWTYKAQVRTAATYLSAFVTQMRWQESSACPYTYLQTKSIVRGNGTKPLAVSSMLGE